MIEKQTDAELTPEFMSDKEMNDFLHALGGAVFHAQSLEYVLVSLYAITSIASGTPIGSDIIRKVMDTRYAQTLGQLIRNAAKDLALSPDLTDLLETSLKERNWLVHHFFREYGAVYQSPKLAHRAIT